MRLVVVCLVCLLAACGPAVVYITPAPVATGDGVLLPEQAQRVIDAYTATARVMATQAALATGTEQSARSTSTAVRAATLDALEGRQTDVALSLTQGAGQAAATDAASIKTQSVQQTRAWSTPTAAALALAVRASTTAIAYQQAQAQADDARNQTVANARDWLLLAVGILFLIGLAAAAVFGVSDLLSARAELLRAAAERATAESRQLWIMQYAGFLLQLRADGWEVMGAPQIMSADIPASGPSLVREAPIKTRGEVVSSIVLGEPETPARERVLHLLGQAIAIAGPSAAFIPSAERLGMHPQDWQLAVDKLKAGPDRLAYIVTRTGRPKAGQGGNTRLCQPAYLTLSALRDGVKRGDVLPRPAAPAESSVPGRIQNAHFEPS